MNTKDQKSYLHLVTNQRLILLAFSLIVVVYWILPTAKKDLLVWTQTPLLNSEWKMLFNLNLLEGHFQDLSQSADEFYVFYLLTISIVYFSLCMVACLALLAKAEMLKYLSNLRLLYRLFIIVGILHMLQNISMCCYIWLGKSILFYLLIFKGLLLIKYLILIGAILIIIRKVSTYWLNLGHPSKNEI